MADRSESTDGGSAEPLHAHASAAYLEIARAYTAPPGTPHSAPHVYERPVDAAGLRAPAYETARHPVVAAYAAGSAVPPAYAQGTLPPAYAPKTPTPSAPQADRRPRGLARWALALTIIGGLLQIVPFGRGFGRFLLFGAVVLAIIALVRRRSGGKGIATAAIAFSVFAWVLSLVIGLVSGFFPGSSDPSTVDRGSITDPGPVYVPQDGDIPFLESSIGTESGGATWVAGTFDTPPAYIGARYLDVDVIALDSTGRVLDRGAESYTSPSGRLTVAATFFDLDRRVASVVLQATSTPDTSADPDAPVLTSEITGTEALPSMTTIEGILRSTSTEPSTFVNVTVIARAPDGTIIGGGDGWADEVPPDGQAGPFTANIYASLPPDTVYESYPTSW